MIFTQCFDNISNMKNLVKIFIFSFATNLIWENLHQYLYVSYKGGEITQLILIRASLFDAVLVTIILIPFLYFSFFKKRVWLIIIIGIMIAIFNELYGLGTSRWIYNSYMPIFPIFNVGISPMLQLGLTGYLTYKFQEEK